MQKRLLVSGLVLALILGAGYVVMQLTNNEETPQSVTNSEGVIPTNSAQKEAGAATADQSSTTDEAAVALTATEVARHATENDCWVIVNNGVYNVTQYAPRHPGGKGKIVPLCGKDATSAFEGQHGGDTKPETMLAKLKIGDVQK